MDYKRNHYIPTSLIKSWLIKDSSVYGLYVYNIVKEKRFFCQYNNKRKFSFAMRKNLYVTEVNQIRLTSVERWFSSQETQLSKFLNIVDSLKNKAVYKDVNKFSLSIKALIGLEFRSRVAIIEIKKFLESNPKILNKISPNNNYDIDKLVLENLIQVIDNETHRVMPSQIIVNKTDCKEFILCDRPVIILDDSKCYIAGRKRIINIRKNDQDNSYINFGNNYDETADIINHQLALQARDWILSSNKQLLEKYIQVINSNEYRCSLKKDHIKMLKPDHSKAGYEIID